MTEFAKNEKNDLGAEARPGVPPECGGRILELVHSRSTRTAELKKIEEEQAAEKRKSDIQQYQTIEGPRRLQGEDEGLLR